MSFNSRPLRFSLSLLLVLTLGCGLKTNEKPPSETPISFSGNGYNCVGQIPEHLQLYFQDQLSEAQITTFVQCLEKSFVSFARLTRGREESTYAPEELRSFLESYFLKNHKISDELLKQFMSLKQVVLGGSRERISRSELYVAVEVLEELRAEAIRLKPHIQMLNMNLVVKQSPEALGERLGEAYKALSQSIQIFSARLESSKVDYSIADFESFLREFRQFIHWEDHFPETHTAGQWALFIKVYKQAAVSPAHPDVIRPDEWAPFLKSISRWYLSFLQYEVGIKSQPVLQGVGLQNLLYLAQEVFDLTEEAIRRQPNKIITFRQIDQVVGAMKEIGWIPKYIRPESLNEAIVMLVTRILGDSDVRPVERKAQGLTLKALEVAKNEFYHWSDIQTELDKRFNQELPLDRLVVPSLQNLHPSLQVMRARSLADDNSAWDNFEKVTKLMRPLYQEQGLRVFILPERDLMSVRVYQGFGNLSKMNMLRASVGLIFRGYSEDPTGRWTWNSGIGSNELQQFYLDVRDLAIDLELADKRQTNVGSRAFIEGNLFTYASDGLSPDAKGLAGELSFIEAMQLGAFLVSGGDTGTQIYHDLMARCEVYGPPKLGPIPHDNYDRPKIDRGCAEIHLSSVMLSNMGNVPGLRDYIQKLGPIQAKAYVKELLETAYSPVNSNRQWIEKSELDTLAVVSQYSEAVLTRFDVNGDGVLDNSEIESAIPIFVGFIKKIAHEKMNMDNLTDAYARAAFVYILANKTIPGFWDKFAVWRYVNTWEPTLALDRSELAKVFRAIIERIVATGSPSPASPPSPDTKN